MLASIGRSSGLGFQFLEKGLAHPSFLGRLVSWGVFYGVLVITVSKVTQYALPKMKEYLEDRKTKGKETKTTPKISGFEPIKDDREIDPKPLNPAPQPRPITSEIENLDHKEGQKPTGEPGEGVKKKTSGWFNG